MPMPNRCTSGRWRYGKRRSVPIIPMSRLSLNNLAALYQDQGRYADAEPLYKRSLAIREKALGPDHPDVATVAEQSGCAVPSSRSLCRCRAAVQAVIGDTGKGTRSRSSRCRTSLNNLAELYQAKVAMPMPSRLYKRSLAIREKALGPDHPDVATSLNNLAVLYRQPRSLCRCRAAVQAIIGDTGKGARSRSSRCRAVAEQSGFAVCRSRSLCRCRAAVQAIIGEYAKRRSVPIIPMSQCR